MAATTADKVAIATGLQDLAKMLKGAKYLADQLVAKNQAEAASWGAGDDAALAAANLNCTGDEVSNALGSLTQFKNFWTNAAVTQGDHGGNFEKLAPPIV